MGLIALAPGVQAAGAQDQLATRGVTRSGRHRRAQRLRRARVDAGRRDQPGSDAAAREGEVPSIDAIAQFKVLSNGAPAEFNQPAQIIVVSASGTNKFHGEALEYNRSKGTSAKSLLRRRRAAPSLRAERVRRQSLRAHLHSARSTTAATAASSSSAFEGFRLTQSYCAQYAAAQPAGAPGQLQRAAAREDLRDEHRRGTHYQESCDRHCLIRAISSPHRPLNTVSLAAAECPLSPAHAAGHRREHLRTGAGDSASRPATRCGWTIGSTTNDQLRFTYLRAFYGPNADAGRATACRAATSRTANTTATSSSAARTPFPRHC